MRNYFKKFSIMFVMALAIIGFGTIQNGIAANAATIGENLLQPENGWKRCDDIEYIDSKIITLTGEWWKDISSYTNSGYYGTNDDKAKMNFNFTGDKIRFVTDTWSNKPNNISVSIDNEIITTFSENMNGRKLTLVYEKVGLESKEHYVTISMPKDMKEKNLNANIDCIDIDTNGELKPYNENIFKSISLNKSTDSLQIGQTDNLVATTTPVAIGVTWKSSDASIATVDSNGKVTAIKEGQATITATTTDGSNLSASCAVTVTTKPVVPTPEPTESDKIVNIAHAKGDNTNNAGGDVTIIFHGTADTTLSVVKTADVKDVWVGDNFTYTIVVTNTGTKTAKAVIVNDPAPNHIDFLVNGITTTQGKVDASSTAKNVIVNVGDIPPLGTVTIKIPSTVVM